MTDTLVRPLRARTSPAPATRAPEQPQVQWRTRVPYLPGLDGMRAIAVMAVLLYHAGLTGFWGGELMKGGFLGVEVFFVISGYLITAILLAGWRNERRVDFGTFYIRRARRLLPALFLTLAAVVALSLVFLPDEVATLRGDVASSITYVTNWFFIFSQKSYFESVGRPSLVQHLWSLAVEEQFYLVWPVLFSLGMKHLGRTRLLLATVVGAVASAGLMAFLYANGTDITRVYEGTDTRAAGILIGAALAFVWSPWRLRTKVGRGAVVLLDGAGFAAGGVLLVVLAMTDQFSPALYQFGFAKISLVTALVIAVAVHPAAHLGRALGWRPLRWIGLRSYGIYLFHWPIFQLTRPQLDVPISGLPLLALRLGLTFAAAELSYRYVEIPIRNGVLSRWWKAARDGRGAQGLRVRAQFSGVLAVFLLLLAGLTLGAVRAQPAEVPDYLSAVSSTGDQPPGSIALPPARVDTTLPPTTTTTAAPTTVAPDPAAVPTTVPAPTAAPVPTTPAPPPPVGLQITAIGDSVMLGAVGPMQNNLSGFVYADARVGRQVGEALAILTAWRDQGRLGDRVVVHIGNNGTFTADQFEQLKAILAGVPKVIVLTVKVPRSWEGSNNDVIMGGVASMPNAVLIDWKSQGDAHPELFYDDGMHLRPDGAAFYTQLINSAL